MEISRRTFLKVGLAGVAGSALTPAPHLLAGGAQKLDRLTEPNLYRDFPEEWIPSVCSACPAACPVFLRRIGSNIVGVRPSENKPCARAYTIPQELYHPDRLRAPLKARGKRGSGSWQTLSRKAAIEEITSVLRESGAKTAIVIRDDSGLSFALLRAIVSALGSSYLFTYEQTFNRGPVDALQLATAWGEWRYDFSEAAGILSFGWDWLQNFSDFSTHSAFGALRKRDAPILYVGPRLNLTAMKSNEWLACRPGFEPLAALGIAHVLAREKLYDADLNKVEGFAELTQNLEQFDLTDVAQQTGIPIRHLRKLAHTIAERRPFLCLGGRGRLEDQWALVALNALLGNIGRAGGILPEAEVALPLTATSPQNTSHVEDLPKILMEEGAIDTVLLVDVNPAFDSPAPERWRKALKRVNRVICLTSFLDETSALADLVLPLALPAERREIYLTSHEGRVIPRTIEPALPSSAELFTPAELAFEVVGHLDDKTEESFRWKSLEEAARDVVARSPSVANLNFTNFDVRWSAPSFSEGEFSLLLESQSHLRPEGGRLPYLLTTVAPHLREWWTTWVEINPITARRKGIRDHDEVAVESKTGVIRARARIYAGVPPDAVCLPIGLGHTTGQFAQKEGGNPMELIEFQQDEQTRTPLLNIQKVTIRRI
ncbi:MAG: molybdopterin-dependent oxidoreductase [Candidatus Poribacteria bacterium]